MAQLMGAFNPNEVDPTQSIGGLPIGKHKVQIVESQVTPTKDGDGGMLVFDLEILEGTYQGQKGAWRLGLYIEKSEDAMRIAKQNLSALCHSVGHLQPLTDSSVLHGRPFMVEVQAQKNNPQYTEVKRVFDINGNAPSKGQAPAAAPVAPAAPAAPAPAAPVAPQPPAQQQWGANAAPETPAAPAPQAEQWSQSSQPPAPTAPWGQAPQ